MRSAIEHEFFPGRLVVVGFGSVGQAALPVLLRHIAIAPGRITVIAADAAGKSVARECGAELVVCRLTPENYQRTLEPLLASGDFLLNLSVEVSSLALIELCSQRGVLYLDTCIEPWPGGYDSDTLSPAQRSNYALREAVLAFRRTHRRGPTAVLTQGANPGLASFFVKQALLNMAADQGLAAPSPADHAEWAQLARRLGIRAIHIAERDTQSSPRRKRRDEFVNTWSVAGFTAEGLQPAELGWGTHERHWPSDAQRHASGSGAAIYLQRPGAATFVRSWTPLEGPYHGHLITHGESISIADHLTLRDGDKVLYRPTVLYAYHPCDDAVLSLNELRGRNWRLQSQQRILRDEIDHGMDELGVLLMGSRGGVYWFGSHLTIEQARHLAPYNNATSLQVAAGILGGVVWALRHPTAGIVEPDDMDCDVVLDVARPYLGDMVGVYGDWTPLADRSRLFHDQRDDSDPWQFCNFRVL